MIFTNNNTVFHDLKTTVAYRMYDYGKISYYSYIFLLKHTLLIIHIYICSIKTFLIDDPLFYINFFVSLFNFVNKSI